MTADSQHLMQDFSAMHFVFVCEALEYIKLDAQPGTAIRGALYHALVNLFSPNEPIPGLPLDPVRALLAAEDEDNARGRDLPRAFAVEPPPPYTEITKGGRFRFGVALFGTADRLMPHLFRALPEMGQNGIGKGRGRFRLIQIEEVTPLDDTRNVIVTPQNVRPPQLTVTHARVLAEAKKRSHEAVTIRFLTPMRLIEGGKLVHEPKLSTLLLRLIDRAQALVEHYTPTPEAAPSRELWKAEWQRMGTLGEQIDANGLLWDATRWVNIQSYSKARGKATPIGGFVGQARWQINSFDVLVWLLWGQSLHIGKNVAKGDGYFRVE